MRSRGKRIWQIATTTIFLALGSLVVLRNYDDAWMRAGGIVVFAAVAYFVIFRAGDF
jgi:hypothetical protein